jgi:small nuclear ribonucleoprotein (snRNP)-like protein
MISGRSRIWPDSEKWPDIRPEPELSSGATLIVTDVCVVRLNGGRVVTGVLRGFDPFMNLVIDDAIEECKTGEKNQIGMVVSRCNYR